MPTCRDSKRSVLAWLPGVIGLAVWGCSQESTGLVSISDGSESVVQGTCLPGSAGCECRTDQSCDVGLTCSVGACVLPGATGTGDGASTGSQGPASVPASPSAAPGESSGAGTGVGGAPPSTGSAVPPAEKQPLPAGVNAVENGDFSAGDTHWRVDDGAGNGVTHSTTSGAMCVTVGALQPTAVMRWPLDGSMGVKLAEGVHQFTYEAWSTQPMGVVFEAKIGAAKEPYMDHFFVAVELGATSESYSHAFNARSSATTGVAFEVTSMGQDATVCVDNVSLKGL